MFNSMSKNDFQTSSKTERIPSFPYWSFLSDFLLIELKIAFDLPAESSGPASNLECAATIK